METLVEDLVKIFLYQFIKMSFINFETSKLLKLASYDDFKSERDVMKLQCEKRCGHFSEAKFIGHLEPDPPPEYFRTDKFDPYQTVKYPTYCSVPFTIVGDLLDPVYPLPHSHREIEQYIENLSAKIKAPNELNPLLIMRAVRDVNNGHPLNPQNEKSWSQAALSLTAELAGNYIADTDKSALDTSHAVFANILDPGYLYPGDSSVHIMEFSTPLARFSHSTAPTRDILETPSDTSTISDDPATLVNQKMGRDDYPFPSPSTISSTPSRASTLAMELQPYSSTGGTPFPTPKEAETVKRQVLQTTPPSRMGAQQEATTPGMEGVQPLEQPLKEWKEYSKWQQPLEEWKEHSKWQQPLKEWKEHSKWQQPLEEWKEHSKWQQPLKEWKEHSKWQQPLEEWKEYSKWQQPFKEWKEHSKWQ